MISKKMESLTASSSLIRAMFEEGKKLASIYGAENVYDFSLGNPSVEAPEAVKEAAIKVLTETKPMALHGYPNNSGFEDVRLYLANLSNKRHGTNYNERNYVLTTGAAAALNIIFKTLLNAGDEVVVFTPYFSEYDNYIENYGGTVVRVAPNTETFQPNMEDFASKLTAKTKAVIINTPNNPTGVIYSAETLTKMADILNSKQAETGNPIYLISDEPYRELVYGDTKIPFVPDFYKNTFVAYSYSKSLSLPGERIGYVCVNTAADDFELITDALNIANRILGFVNAPTIWQRVLPYIGELSVDVSIYEKNRNKVYSMLRELGYECVEPEGAFYVFPKSLIPDDKEFCKAAKEFNILIVPGSSFGCPGHFRLSYCVSYDTIANSYEGFKKLKEKYSK